MDASEIKLECLKLAAGLLSPESKVDELIVIATRLLRFVEGNNQQLPCNIGDKE